MCSDPLGRHRQIGKSKLPIVQIALIAENEALQKTLEDYGINTQTPSQIQPIEIRTADTLTEVYAELGKNKKLKFSGMLSLTHSLSLPTRLRSLTLSPALSLTSYPLSLALMVVDVN